MPERAKILLVDDLPANLLALGAILDRPDYELVRATSGEQAIRHVREGGEFAVALLDVAMPGMDGFATAAGLRVHAKAATLPIVFVTATPQDKRSVYEAYRVGAVDYLEKPLEPDVVRAKVAVFVELFRQRRELARQAASLRELEVNRLRLEAAQAAIAMRDEFLSIASHELRTPLTPLQLQVQGLQRAIKKGTALSERAVAERLGLVMRQVTRMASLVDGLLDVSRIAHGKLELQREPIDLALVVREVCDRFRDEALRARATLTIETNPVVGRWDRMRIDQVVTNVLSNALKYGAGRPVDVRVGPKGDDAALLTIRDHGIGIGSEHLSRIFERFERGVSSKNYGGLGLGLYIARMIVEAHGGVIEVESEPNAGALFSVTLPLS